MPGPASGVWRQDGGHADDDRMTDTDTAARPSWPRRIAPVAGLLVLAPWTGEYLLGNISARQIAALPFLVPLYGGGALLIRETARRTGRGWAAILLLGAAYGVIEAGLVDQSLFNPSFEGHDFQPVTPVPWLGISAYYLTVFVAGHAIWSIGVPVALTELLVPARRTAPWLGLPGLLVTAALYLLGCWLIFQDLQRTENFLASPAQLAAAAGAALVLIGGAFTVRRRGPARCRAVPSPGWLGLGAFAAASAFFARPENWYGVLLGLAILGLAWPLVAAWSRQPAWGPRREFALAAGAMLTYAWGGFALTSLLQPADPVRWAGNAAFAAIAIGLLIVTGRRTGSGDPTPPGSGSATADR